MSGQRAESVLRRSEFIYRWRSYQHVSIRNKQKGERSRGGGHSLSLSLLPLNIFIAPFQKSPNYRSNFSLQLVRVGVSTFPTDIKNTGLIQHAEVEVTNLCRLHTAHNAQSWAEYCVCECVCAEKREKSKRCNSMLSQKSVCVCVWEQSRQLAWKSLHLWLCLCVYWSLVHYVAVCFSVYTTAKMSFP